MHQQDLGRRQENERHGRTAGQWAVAPQQPVAAAFGNKMATKAWQTKPSWYIVANNDHMIIPILEQAMAKKIKATTLTLQASHVPMLSQPQKVADFIVEAAKKAPVR